MPKITVIFFYLTIKINTKTMIIQRMIQTISIVHIQKVTIKKLIFENNL